MTRKIFNSIIIVAGTILLASVIIIMGSLYSYFESVREKELKDNLNLLVSAVEKCGINYLEDIKSDRYRVTWISADGTVIYDTITDNEKNENHLERAEVKSALETGEGKSNRYSNTLMEKTMYYAKRMKDGSVLRISVSSLTVWYLVLGMVQPIVIVVIIAIVCSAMLAGRLSKRIVKPLNELDLDDPLENNAYEEISPLLIRINRQNKKINAQFKELRQREAEFEKITSCMSEGLIMLDKQGIILSINHAANKIFDLEQNAAGKNFLEVYRDHEMSLCIKNAAESGHGEIQKSKSGREYQFDVSRIESEDDILGTVVLIFDITEKMQAERSRREFTANVSHELKTPLQGIIGSAELIENGMVKQEDMPRFIGHIRKEASRLVTLVGDIIRLSQLDEKTELEKEQVNLLEIAYEVSETLSSIAKEKNIDIKVSGEHVTVSGVRKLLHEIIYNLCDNAIKYNIDGGNAEISVTRNDQNAILTVTDTGIGIPNEHIDRVFERFYRVDKSHSKESGGTGLGLSIVKHAVLYHKGTIDIKSSKNSGTTIKIELPI